MKKENKIKSVINILFYVYFLILLFERILSVSLSLSNGVNLFGERFHLYAYLTVFLSFIGFFCYLFIFCRKSMYALVHFNDEAVENIKFASLSIAAGILLLSGMVHTEYTISGIQFVSYGVLIVGLLLQAILINKNAKDKGFLWLSFIYLVCFSMAIPVSYPSMLSYRLYFYLTEVVATYGLVTIFTLMMIRFFSPSEDLFKPWPYFATMIVLDAVVIALKWQEEINWFVLIFALVSALLYFVGLLYKTIKNRNK